MSLTALHVSSPKQEEAILGKVAFVMSNAIGDSLVSMVIVRNLCKNGLDVTVFGGAAYPLRDWFPGVRIEAMPPPGALDAVLAEYQTVIVQHPALVEALQLAHPNLLTLHEVEYGQRAGCMAERFADFCRDGLGLADIACDNGMTSPGGLQHRHYRQRVVIHPEASTDEKRWSRTQFIRLAHRLRARGFDVQFVIGPKERVRWADLDKEGIASPQFDSLHALAAWIYESGWFIGNDSGVGHLASNLGLPTISLFRRRGVAERWRPAWGQATVLLSWQWVPTSFLKERFWRETLTCRKVLSTFAKLVARDGARLSGEEAPLDRTVRLGLARHR